jgi:hypothetical protein
MLLWKRTASLLGPILLALVLSFALNVAFVRSHPPATFYLPLTRLWELLMGGLLALPTVRPSPIVERLVKRVRNVVSPLNLEDWSGAVGALMIAVAVAFFDEKQAFPGWLALVPTLGAFLVIAAGPNAWVNRQVLALRPIVFIGLISFPIYLWHWPLLSFATIVNSQTPSAAVRVAAVSVSFVAAWLTYRFVETHLRFGKHATAKVTSLSITMIALAAAGSWAYLHGGSRLRNSASAAMLLDLVEPHDTNTSDGSCERLLSHWSVAEEVCLAKTSQPEVLVMGDSHAMSFNSAAYSKLAPLNTVLVAASSCMPFSQIESRRTDQVTFGHNCRAVTGSALRLAHSLPSIGTVVLVSSPPGKDETRQIYRNADGARVDPERAFVDGYVDTSNELLAMGKRVVFVIDVPGLDAPPTGCLARPLAFHEPGTCSLDRRRFEESRRPYLALVTEIQEHVPRLLIYDSAVAFCDDERCSGKSEGHLYYHDTQHLSVAGSAKLLRSFAPWLALH